MLKSGDKIRIKATGDVLTVRQYVPNMHPPIITEESECLFDDREVEPVSQVIEQLTDSELDKELAFARGFAPATSDDEQLWLDRLEAEKQRRDNQTTHKQ